MTLRVLLVEDDPDIAAGLGDYLQANGVEVDFARDAAQARHVLRSAEFDVCVLDVNLPGVDGVSLCRELKQDWNLEIPVIFLTARGALADKLAGFEAGGIDWMVKPFEPAELLARLRALTAHAAMTMASEVLQVGDYVLQPRAGLLRLGERGLQLHATASAILQILMRTYPAAVTRTRLVDEMWPDAVPGSDPLRAHMHLLRQAILDAFGTRPIMTERGIGYRFGDEA